MQNVERLSITLPADMAKLIRGQVAEGRYASNSEVIREAVRAWEEQNTLKEGRLAQMRAAIAESVNDPRSDLSDAEVDAHFEAKRGDAGEHG